MPEVVFSCSPGGEHRAGLVLETGVPDLSPVESAAPFLGNLVQEGPVGPTARCHELVGLVWGLSRSPRPSPGEGRVLPVLYGITFGLARSQTPWVGSSLCAGKTPRAVSPQTWLACRSLCPHSKRAFAQNRRLVGDCGSRGKWWSQAALWFGGPNFQLTAASGRQQNFFLAEPVGQFSGRILSFLALSFSCLVLRRVVNPISRVGTAARLGRGREGPCMAHRTHTWAFFLPRRPSRAPEHL